MFPYNVRNTNNNLGFTLPELIITLAVVSLLAAIGIPSFFGMLRKFETNSDFDQVLGAIKEAQLKAIQLSKTCTIRIDETASNQIAINNTTDHKGCLLNPVTLPKETRIKTNNDDSIVSFNFKGNTNTTQTIVVSDKTGAYQRCLVISTGIGMVRSGFYEGTLTNDPNKDQCKTQQ